MIIDFNYNWCQLSHFVKLKKNEELVNDQYGVNHVFYIRKIIRIKGDHLSGLGLGVIW